MFFDLTDSFIFNNAPSDFLIITDSGKVQFCVTKSQIPQNLFLCSFVFWCFGGRIYFSREIGNS